MWFQYPEGNTPGPKPQYCIYIVNFFATIYSIQTSVHTVYYLFLAENEPKRPGTNSTDDRKQEEIPPQARPTEQTAHSHDVHEQSRPPAPSKKATQTPQGSGDQNHRGPRDHDRSSQTRPQHTGTGPQGKAHPQGQTPAATASSSKSNGYRQEQGAQNGRQTIQVASAMSDGMYLPHRVWRVIGQNS